ncbi:helix-turn-helix transcriptional regulator [Pseudomonas sp. XK-1]|uniref:helix-turn-helix transcriptional regulator n=1 Tax=Pseudomonas sp. XK-1 TaxID=3136019 RepID=UPI003119B8D0
MQSTELGQRCLNTFTQLIPASGCVFYRIAAQLEPHDFLLQKMHSDMHERYLSQYRRVDPLQPRNCQLTGHSVVPLRLGMSAQDDLSNRRYDGFLQSYGVVDVVEVLAFEQGRPVAGISLLRGCDLGVFGPHELEQLQALQGMFELAVAPRLSSTPTLQLTSREWQVAELLRAGRSNKEIARQLGVGLPTIKTHLINLFRKVAVSNRTELVATLFL